RRRRGGSARGRRYFLGKERGGGQNGADGVEGTEFGHKRSGGSALFARAAATRKGLCELAENDHPWKSASAHDISPPPSHLGRIGERRFAAQYRGDAGPPRGKDRDHRRRESQRLRARGFPSRSPDRGAGRDVR